MCDCRYYTLVCILKGKLINFQCVIMRPRWYVFFLLFERQIIIKNMYLLLYASFVDWNKIVMFYISLLFSLLQTVAYRGSTDYRWLDRVEKSDLQDIRNDSNISWAAYQQVVNLITMLLRQLQHYCLCSQITLSL